MVLMQETCQGRKKPALAYYSPKLDSMAQGWPPCYQAVWALQFAYNKASLLTMRNLIFIYTHHKIKELLEKEKIVLMAPRSLLYSALLMYPDITLAPQTIQLK